MPKPRAVTRYSGVYRTMWLRLLIASTLVTALHAGTPADGRGSGSCTTMNLLSRFDPVSGNFSLRKGEIYRRTPVFHYAIDDQGRVINLRLVRGSGVKRLDAAVLNEIKQWHFQPRPGCPAIETDTSITIDWF